MIVLVALVILAFMLGVGAALLYHWWLRGRLIYLNCIHAAKRTGR